MKTNKITIGLLAALISLFAVSCDSLYKADLPMNGSQDFPFDVKMLYSVNPSDSASFTGIWLKGYIVGSVDNGKYQFGTPFTSKANLLVADNADEKDPAKCGIIQFQAGKIQDTLNLVSHPERLGKSAMIYGNSTFFTPKRGLKRVSGYIIDGENYAPVAAGTYENPYDISEAMSHQASQAAWVTGYIVGCVNGAAIATGSVFIAPFPSTTNILLATTPNETNYAKCIPVQLTTGTLIATKVNLSANPTNIKRPIKILGLLQAYFGLPGLKSTTGYMFLDNNTGYNPGTPIFSETFLSSTLGQFTTNNVSGTQVWASSSYGATFNGVAGVANEDWLISPTINLTGRKSVVLRFDQAINYAVVASMPTEHTLWISSNNGTSWTQITIPTYPAGTNWTFVNSGDVIIPTSYFNSTFKFAFKMATSAKPGWEIKNVTVSYY